MGTNKGKDYVVGFMFNDRGSSVVLITKNRPSIQAGLLNGPGGAMTTTTSADRRKKL